MNHSRPKLAIFFDAENLSLTNAPAILQKLSADWDIHLRRAYGSNLLAQEEILRELSIIPVEVLHNTKSKNSTDLALTVDATEELCIGNSDGICIVSGDSDFTRLVQRIREKGKTAIAFGKPTTPISLRNACTVFHAVASAVPAAGNVRKAEPKAKPPQIVAPLKPATAVAAPKIPKAVAAPTAKAPKVVAPRKAMSQELANNLRRDLRRTFQEFRGPNGSDTLAEFGDFLRQHYPQFHHKKFGFGRLRTLLANVGGFHMTPVHHDNGVIRGYRLSLTKESVSTAADAAAKPASAGEGIAASRGKDPTRG